MQPVKASIEKRNVLWHSWIGGFFGRLKNEVFYGRSWIGVSPDDFAQELDDYINWYNCKRIKLSLGGLSPIEYRQRLGCAV